MQSFVLLNQLAQMSIPVNSLLSARHWSDYKRLFRYTLTCRPTSRILKQAVIPSFLSVYIIWNCPTVEPTVPFMSPLIPLSFLCSEPVHYILFLFCFFSATQRGSWPPHSWGFLDHIQRRTTVGRTPLDEWSARRRDIYLTTHNNHNTQTSMPPVGFLPTISADERPQTYAIDRAATGTGIYFIYWFYISVFL
jgi:hypothetical protein